MTAGLLVSLFGTVCDCPSLLALPGCSGERLCSGTVSVCPSVCLSVPSIDTRWLQRSASAFPQPGRRRQIPIDSCGRRRVAQRRAGSVIAVIRGGSTPSCIRHIASLIFVVTTPHLIVDSKCAYRCSAPAVWNSLPRTVLSSDSVAVFKSRLTTFLFSQAFASYSAH